MLLSKRLLKPIAGLLIPVFVLTSVFSSVSFADMASQNGRNISHEDAAAQNVKRVVVSMGDSFSAGEGISPFYGDRNSDLSVIADWLAHRSKLAWSGMLYLDKDNQDDCLYKHKTSFNPEHNKDDDTEWYFVASSGALTTHLYGKQEKRFSKVKGLDVTIYNTELEPQVNILKKLRNEDKVVPDYITMTLGGNDVDFVPVITKASISPIFTDPNELEVALNTAMKKLTRGDNGEKSIREKLRESYRSIDKETRIGHKKPCIIVAGYPRLLNTDVANTIVLPAFVDPIDKIKRSQLLFDVSEAKKVNDCIDYFDETIKQLVNQCKSRDGLDMEFVDVRTKFNGHEVYTKDPWINGAEIIPHDDDLITLPLSIKSDKKIEEEKEEREKKGEDNNKDKSLVEKIFEKYDYNPSGCSIHPNAKGAYYGYRQCVQEIIDKREALKKNKPTSTPTSVSTPENTIPSISIPRIDETKSPDSETVWDPVSCRKVIKFGFNNGRDIEWIILEDDENEMFLLSKDVIVSKAYNEGRNDTTWEDCSLRKWLNKEFYQRAFTKDEQARINKTNLINVPNRVSGLNGGNETEDKVFLLSVHEAELYFGKGMAEKATAKDVDGRYTYSWWLRSPGLYGNQAAFIDTSGYLSDLGDYVDIDTYGVRPAMWISKKAVEEEPTTTTTTEPSETVKPDDRGIAVLDSPNSTVIDVDGETHDFKIPMIRIPDVPVSLTNKAIERQVNKFNIHKTKQYLNAPYDSHYRYHITEKTITIIVDFWRINGGEDERDELIFNVDIKTGELMSGSQVVKLFGMTDKQFFAKVKVCYKNFYDLERKNRDNDPKAKKMAKTLYDKNLKLVSYKYIVPFVDENGRLMFAGKVNYLAAGGYGYLFFSIDKENINYYWRDV